MSAARLERPPHEAVGVFWFSRISFPHHNRWWRFQKQNAARGGPALDGFEHYLSSGEIPNPERAELYWAEYRAGGPGAEAAFATLIAWHGAGLRRCIWRHATPSELDDVLQDVLTQLHKCRGRFDTFEHALRWLYTVAVSRSIDAHRRAARKRRLEASVAARPDAVAPPGADAELHEALRVALGKLPPKFRAVVDLVFFAGMDHKSAAGVLGIDRDTVSSRKAEAIDRLRKLIPVATVLVAGGALNVPAVLSARPEPMSATRLAELAREALKETAASWPAWSKPVLVAVAVVLSGGIAVGGWVLTREAEPTRPVPAAVAADQHPTPRPAPETLQQKHERVFATELRPKVERAIQKLVPPTGGTARIETVDVYDTRLELLVSVRQGEPRPMLTHLKLVYDSRGGDHRVLVDLLGNGRWQGINPAKPVYWTVPGVGELVYRFEGIDDILKAFREMDWTDPRQDPEHASRLAAFRTAAEPFLGQWFEDGNGAKPFKVEFDPSAGVVLKYTFHTRLHSGRGVVDLRIGPDGRLESPGLGTITPDGVWRDFPDAGRVSTRQPKQQ